MTRPNVLIITAAGDTTADLVLTHVKALGANVSRFDIADFPTKLAMEAYLDPLNGSDWAGLMVNEIAPVDLRSIDGIYYRKPTPFKFPAAMQFDERRFADLEAQAGFLGVLASVDTTWVNHPLSEMPASYKPLQLVRALRAGLMPPRTLVSNSPEAARHFADDLGGTVLYKGIGKDLVEPGAIAVPTTRIVSSAELWQSDGLAITTHLFQEVIEKTHDVRVTAVGDWMCAVEIHTPGGVLDWRTAYEQHEYVALVVPSAIAKGLRDFMAAYGVVFAAFDFAVDARGVWRFLEMNSNGEWLWLEEVLDLGIAKSIAEALITR